MSPVSNNNGICILEHSRRDRTVVSQISVAASTLPHDRQRFFTVAISVVVSLTR